MSYLDKVTEEITGNAGSQEQPVETKVETPVETTTPTPSPTPTQTPTPTPTHLWDSRREVQSY